MSHVDGFVDCVSLSCPDLLTSTIQKLLVVAPGSVIEVICDDRFKAGQLMADIPRLGHKVLGVSQDPLHNFRVLIERIY